MKSVKKREVKTSMSIKLSWFTFNKEVSIKHLKEELNE
jgi:hypothetical protein